MSMNPVFMSPGVSFISLSPIFRFAAKQNNKRMKKVGGKPCKSRTPVLRDHGN